MCRWRAEDGSLTSDPCTFGTGCPRVDRAIRRLATNDLPWPFLDPTLIGVTVQDWWHNGNCTKWLPWRNPWSWHLMRSLYAILHGDLTTWRCLSHYWSFVRGIHMAVTDGFPHKGPVMRSCHCNKCRSHSWYVMVIFSWHKTPHRSPVKVRFEVPFC